MRPFCELQLSQSYAVSKPRFMIDNVLTLAVCPPVLCRTVVYVHVIAHQPMRGWLSPSIAMSHDSCLALVLMALFSCVHVAHSDLSTTVKTYPPSRHDRPPSSQHGRPVGRMPPPHAAAPPMPAVPLPGYVLMTAPSSGEFEPDNEMEVTHEFKLRIEARREMCVFQKVRQNARLYVSFKVRASRTSNYLGSRYDDTSCRSSGTCIRYRSILAGTRHRQLSINICCPCLSSEANRPSRRCCCRSTGRTDGHPTVTWTLLRN